MTGIMCAMMGGGGGSSNTISVSYGTYVPGGGSTDTGFGSASGFSGSNFGSRTPAKVTIFGGATLLDCYDQLDGGTGVEIFWLAISGNQTSTSWTSMTVNGSTLTRLALNYGPTYISGSNYTYFGWDVAYGFNPFTTSPVNVVFA